MIINLDIAISRLEAITDSARALSAYQSLDQINQANCNAVSQMLEGLQNYLPDHMSVEAPTVVHVSGKGEVTRNDVNGNDHFSVEFEVNWLATFAISYVLVRHTIEWATEECSASISSCESPELCDALQRYLTDTTDDIAFAIEFGGYDLFNTPCRPSIDDHSMGLIEQLCRQPASDLVEVSHA